MLYVFIWDCFPHGIFVSLSFRTVRCDSCTVQPVAQFLNLNWVKFLQNFAMATFSLVPATRDLGCAQVYSAQHPDLAPWVIGQETKIVIPRLRSKGRRRRLLRLGSVPRVGISTSPVLWCRDSNSLSHPTDHKPDCTICSANNSERHWEPNLCKNLFYLKAVDSLVTSHSAVRHAICLQLHPGAMNAQLVYHSWCGGQPQAMAFGTWTLFPSPGQDLSGLTTLAANKCP